MFAVVLAGGEGARLRPLTRTVAKSMVPVLNRPFLEHLIARLARNGVSDAAFTLGYRADQVEAHFSSRRFRNVGLHFTREEVPLGTAGGVKALAPLLTDTFLVLNGDIYTDLDLTAALDFHRRSKALVTIVLTPVDDPTPYGMVETEPDGRIRRFLEKPAPDQVTTVWVNAGTYIMEPAALELVPQNGHYMFERGLFPTLLERGEPLFAYRSTCFWSDLGTPQRYLDLHKQLLLGRTDTPVPGRQLRPGVWSGRGWEMDASALLHGPVVMGNGCKIGPGAVLQGPLVLGDGVVIGEDARVSGSVLWAGVRVGDKAVVEGGILGSGVAIGDESVIGNGCVLADGASVGNGNRLERGMTLGPGKRLEDGAVFFLPG